MVAVWAINTLFLFFLTIVVLYMIISKGDKSIIIVWLIFGAVLVSIVIFMFLGNKGKKTVDRADNGTSVSTDASVSGKEKIYYQTGQQGEVSHNTSKNISVEEGIEEIRPSDRKDIFSNSQDEPAAAASDDTVKKNSQTDVPEATRKVYMEEIEQLNFSIESAYTDMRNLDIRIDQLLDDAQSAEDAYREAKDNFDLGEIDEQTLNRKKEEWEMWLRNVKGSEEMRDSKLGAIDHYRARIQKLEKSLSGK